LCRFYGWAADTERIARKSVQRLADVAAQAAHPERVSRCRSPTACSRGREGCPHGRRNRHAAAEY
jgi:hypothetical protein